MKTVLAFLLALVASTSFAAAVPLTPGPGIAGTASGFTTASSFTGQFSAASFNSNFTANVGGKAVTMPATMRMAANAGRFAMSAVRLNPLLVGGAVAAWLLGMGLKYAEGQWQNYQAGSAVGSCNGGGAPNIPPNMSESACIAAVGAYYNGAGSTRFVFQYRDGVDFWWRATQPDGYSWNVRLGGWRETGTTAPSYQPATEAELDAIAAAPQPLPDAAAGELAAKGVPLPLEVPHIGPQDIPLSDPYVDPVTGKRYRDQARITPSADAKTANVQATKQEVDEAGNPLKQQDGRTDKPPEEQTDFCKKNPEASACKTFDEAPDSELQKKDNPFSINPVSGFGADNASCPAPQNLFTAGGQQITWDWGQFCTFAQGIRPLIIGFAWLTAIMIVVSVGRRNG